MIVVTRDPSSPPPEPPQAADDHPFRYELTYDGDHRRAYAATLTELCGALIEGYDPAEIGQRLQAEGVPSEHLEDLVTGELDELRIVHAVTVQVRLQADLNARALLDDLTQDQLAVLRGGRVTQPAIDSWDAPVALVLSTHDYQPHGDLPKPDGNIIWLDPRDESTFVESLDTAGVVRLAEHVGPEPGEGLAPIA